MAHCPTCGRRHHRRRTAASAPPLPLFQRGAPPPPQADLTGPMVRMVLLHGCNDAEGEPALLNPGRSLPLAFTTIAAALTAKRDVEAAR